MANTHDSTHETPGSTKSPGDFKRPRACDSCRGLKAWTPDPADLAAQLTRSRFAVIKNDPTSPANDAQRPTVHGTDRHNQSLTVKLTLFSITTPPTRKRQKKADSRVAELERKIDALTATLHAQKAGGPDIKHHGGLPQYEGNTPAAAMPEGSFRLGTLSHDWSTPPQAANRYSDIPPGYGPAQNIQRGPEPKRRKLAEGHAVS